MLHSAVFMTSSWRGNGHQSGTVHTLAAHKAHLVERHHGMAERFRMFKAQHPNVLQRGLMTAGLAALVVSVLIWAAQDSNDSRMLIVAAGHPSLAPAPSQAERATARQSAGWSRARPSTGAIATPRSSRPSLPPGGLRQCRAPWDTDASSGPAIPQTRVHNAAQSVSSVRETAWARRPWMLQTPPPPVVQPVRVDAPLAAPAPAHKAAAAPAPAPAAVFTGATTRANQRDCRRCTCADGCCCTAGSGTSGGGQQPPSRMERGMRQAQ